MRAMRFATIAMLLVPGCAAALGQDDGFKQKLKHCKDKESCEALLREATARKANCKDNTVGYVRCGDAEQDRLFLQLEVDKYLNAERKAEARELEEKRQTAERERQEKRDAAEQERKDAKAKADRERLVADWLFTTRDRCRRKWDAKAIQPGPADATEQERGKAQDACEKAAAEADATHMRGPLSECVARFVETNGLKKPYKCEFRPDVVANVGADKIAEKGPVCDKLCADEGPKALDAKREEEKRLRSPVKCCDGTSSPSCTYGTMRPGCCSNHGGAC